MRRTLGLGLVLGSFLLASPAMADFAFIGSGGSGTDPFGNTWVVKTVAAGDPYAGTLIWGIPGYDNGIILSNASVTITDFHFETLPEPGTSDQFLINLTTQTTGGLTGETRFEVESPSEQLWTRVVSLDQKSVDFFAPGGFTLTPTTGFFVNIDFVSSSLSADDLRFQASYTTAAVPEPAILLLLGPGLAGLALIRRKRN